MLGTMPQFPAGLGLPIRDIHCTQEPEDRQTEYNHALEQTQRNSHVDHRFHLLSLDF
jgi:hypothetical protein